MANTSMRDELVKWLVGDSPDQGDRYMAERLVDAAASIAASGSTTTRRALNGFIEALSNERAKKMREFIASLEPRAHESRPICLCPAATEYDPPCPRHGILGIGVTGRD